MTPPDDIAAIAATDTLLGLADRCEKATGPDRELDFLIDRICRPDEWRYLPTRELGCPVHWLDNDELPNYSASLDAAMTLVPEWLPFEVTRTSPGFPDEAFVWNGNDLGEGDHAVAATPALALCAAALRARAHQENDHEPKD